MTERCNQRCLHCYQDSYSCRELTWDEQLLVVRQYIELLQTWNRERDPLVPRGQITLSGGEPFLREDFFQLLEFLSTKKELFGFSILTNGSLIDSGTARRLGKLAPSFVQVSMDGAKETHDEIRGQGSFESTITAIRNLRREGIRTLVALTAHRKNFHEFPIIAKLCRKLNVSRLWADRLIPLGTPLDPLALNPVETREFFNLMHGELAASRRKWFSKTEIAMHRALQFLVGGGVPYRCTAADSLIAINPDGDLYPCRRMPIPVGNVRKASLATLYYGSDLLRTLREDQRISKGCENCIFKTTCRGGLKCLSHAVKGSPHYADPGCWQASS
ncbi:MAG: radical SAM protein [Syntrophobacteraceae bacterium]